MAGHRGYKCSHYARNNGQWVIGCLSYSNFKSDNLFARSYTIHTALYGRPCPHIHYGPNCSDRSERHSRFPCHLISHGLFRDGEEYLERTSQIILHGRRPTPIIQGFVAERTSLLFVGISFVVVQIWHLTYPHISVTIGVAIISAALILSPSIPGELHPILGSSYFALANAMACRVFRAVLLGTIKDPQMNTAKLMSFYRSTVNTRNDNDIRPDRSSKSQKNVAAEMATATESNGCYPLWERKLGGDDIQPEDISHLVWSRCWSVIKCMYYQQRLWTGCVFAVTRCSSNLFDEWSECMSYLNKSSHFAM